MQFDSDINFQLQAILHFGDDIETILRLLFATALLSLLVQKVRLANPAAEFKTTMEGLPKGSVNVS